MGDVELVGLYWTLSGPVEVHAGREWSLFDFRDRVEAAARVGFAGIGIWHADLEHVLETRTLREMRSILDDNGVRQTEVECLMDWFVDPGDERRTESDRNRNLLFEAAAELGAHHVKVANIPGTPCELPKLTERFAELCADAASRHDALMAYEFMPFDVNVHTLEAVIEVVGGAGAPNGVIAVDTWHCAKLGITPEDLRGLPPELLGWVELSDGQYENLPDPVDEVVNHRRLPGEGEFPLLEDLAVLQELGYKGPWGVEVLSEELRSLPMEEIFQRAYETTAAQFSADVD
ncbi:MAG TPA: sugar phosphate isomerase/epimerase [Solirubrobacteraceae bacterium]|jgi:sugar phosphate isomerase/epimerase